MDCELSFRHAIERRHLVEAGDSVLVAVSGGVDSMVLLDLFVRLSDAHRLKLAVAHVNHGLRGEAADRDEALVRKAAADAGLACFATRWQGSTGGNMHDKARSFRRAFFAEAAAGFHARVIALGHHRDDQAETVLMHLMRGSGLKGLSGMRWRDARGDGRIVIRPLLGTPRLMIEEYAARRGISYARDESNDSCMYTRNALRHRVLPLMCEFNPAIADALAGLAERLNEDEEALDAIARAFASTELKALGSGSVSCSRSAFIELAPALRKRVLRVALEHASGSSAGLGQDHLSRMESIALGGADRASYDLPGPYRFERRFNRLFIVRTEPNCETPELLHSCP